MHKRTSSTGRKTRGAVQRPTRAGWPDNLRAPSSAPGGPLSSPPELAAAVCNQTQGRRSKGRLRIRERWSVHILQDSDHQEWGGRFTVCAKDTPQAAGRVGS
eukprot:scaffold341_cov368-Pavlova_lutheri.AAC.2